jgi:hypothetical protein
MPEIGIFKSYFAFFTAKMNNVGRLYNGGLIQIATKTFPYGIAEVMCRISPGM